MGCLVTAHLKLAAIGAHPRHRERAKKEDLMSSFPRCAELIEMKPGKIAHAIAVLLSSISSLFADSTPSKAEPAKVKFSKKSNKLSEDLSLKADPISFSPGHVSAIRPDPGQRYPWKKSIVTTIFWIGEQPSGNNPVPNRTSSWDKDWTKNYGGFDDPNPARRSNYIPVKFTPRQNPFYCALPYNDKAHTGHRPEAPGVVPWFKEAYQGPAISTCKDRWIAIRKGNRTVYAQWEDAGPFRTDHWQYVFGNERPKPNLNKGAGLDVSPAVRDYLGLNETDVTDWKFVDFSEVPHGPWSTLGDNNTFVINERKKGKTLAEAWFSRSTSPVVK
ncbi:MAG: hypothetical protein DMF22_09220 [Verrucomicrobia bacterium]|nr:MAG: hypothetical protein DMF22_09220 [Verrucomicrobiota bacterium]